MKRLFNEYSAAPYEGNVEHVSALMVDAFQRVWDEVVLADDVCPRDVELLCHQTLSTLFAEYITRRAMTRKQTECQGKCKEHRGPIKRVKVRDLRKGKYWGVFSYCDEAIDEDIRRGLDVSIIGYVQNINDA